MANKIDRINHLIALASHYRDQLAAMAEEFRSLHGARKGSCDDDDLEGVIYDGEDYRCVLTRIRKRRAKHKTDNEH